MVLVVYFKNDIDDQSKNRIFREVERMRYYHYTINSVYITKTPLVTAGEIKINRNNLRGKLDSDATNYTLLKKSNSSDETLDIKHKEIADRVIQVFLKHLKVNPKMSDDFFYDLGGNSLNYYSLLLSMEEEFKINFNLKEGSLTTPLSFYNYIIKNEGEFKNE